MAMRALPIGFRGCARRPAGVARANEHLTAPPAPTNGRACFQNMMVEGSDAVAKPELGTKRVCPVTGRKFYDLNKDPVVSPYTGQAYPLSMFEPQAKPAPAPKPDEEEEEVEAADGAVELVSLEDADAETSEKEAVVTSEDDIEVEDEIDAEDDDTFLEEDEEGDDDVSDLIDGEIEGDEDN